ncbi:tyrosine-protein phosphatase [Gordonia desulfuricans]|nr:tyrosine-protein phosphatase [Gordonia desulfuricans]
MAVESIVNGRDLGGLPVRGGGRTRQGILLRSDAPYLGDADPVHIAWPPATVVDLRDGTEAAKLAASWGTGVRVVNNPVFSGARLDRLVEVSLVDLYDRMLNTSAERIAGALNSFDPDGSTLVHCAAGKDRTGVVVAIALMLADVEPEAIVADYLRTGEAIEHIYARMSDRRRLPAAIGVDHPVFGTPSEAIELVIDRVGGSAGGAWGWVAGNGADEQRLRRWAERFGSEI